jgi:hypothetical protein
MSKKSEQSSQNQEVKVRRMSPRMAAATGQVENMQAMLSALVPNLGVASPLALRPAAQVGKKERCASSGLPHIRIALHDGRLKLNGREVSIPVSTPSVMTGKQFKELMGVYRGNALFVRRSGGLQRVLDPETIEVVHAAEFTHRRERPAFASAPRYSRD